MDVNDVKTLSDAIECLEKHKEKWAISIAVDCGDIDTAVEYVFDLVIEAAVIYQTVAWTKEPPDVDGLQRDLLWKALKEAQHGHKNEN